jgi:FAD:protein FMN transferase
MSQSPLKSFAYEAMGTRWDVTIWDDVTPATFEEMRREILQHTEAFDRTYSRFMETSLVWELSRKTGICEVPEDLTAMLKLYETLYDLSGGVFTPLIGFTLSDLGYDKDYTLTRTESIRPTPPLRETVRILDDTHIELHEHVLLDVGALGKGYFVDTIAAYLDEQGIKRYLVDGSGDIFYRGNGESIRLGLEHPEDTTKVVGVLELHEGSLCGSGVNRRAWNGQHHIINPLSKASSGGILSAWVWADRAAIADGLATCLFLSPPEVFTEALSFESCILNEDYKIKRSAGFSAELF